MRALIVLSGDICSDPGAIAWLDRSDWVICADGGARHLRRLGRLPDLLVGDLDSAQPVDVAWMTGQGVTLRQYPVAKDATDSELAVQASLDFLENKGERSAHEIVLLGAFGSRPDHVLANQLLAADLASQGWRLVLTDGVSCLYTLAGGQTLTITQPAVRGSQTFTVAQPAVPGGDKHADLTGQDHADRPGRWAFSVVPVTQTISGLTYHDGLVWPLTDAVLMRGTTRGVSNRFLEPDQPADDSRLADHILLAKRENLSGKMPYQATLSLEKGIALVIVTPED